MPILFLSLVTLIFAFFREAWDIFRNPKYRSIFLWFIILLIVGTAFYSSVEGWSLLDSLYFCVVTLATVGYGDFEPSTSGSKVFTIVYILFGISLLATFVNLLAKQRSILDEQRAAKIAGKKSG